MGPVSSSPDECAVTSCLSKKQDGLRRRRRGEARLALRKLMIVLSLGIVNERSRWTLGGHKRESGGVGENFFAACFSRPPSAVHTTHRDTTHHTHTKNHCFNTPKRIRGKSSSHHERAVPAAQTTLETGSALRRPTQRSNNAPWCPDWGESSCCACWLSRVA